MCQRKRNSVQENGGVFNLLSKLREFLNMIDEVSKWYLECYFVQYP